MDPQKVVRAICSNFKSEIAGGDFTKEIALRTKWKKSHARGAGILAKSGILLRYTVDIEKPIKLNKGHKPEGSNRNRYTWQSQVDVVLLDSAGNQALLEYESPDLTKETIKKKLKKWKHLYPNPQIMLQVVVFITLYKEKVEQKWEQRDRTRLVDMAKKEMKEWSNDFQTSFSVVSIEDEFINSYYFEKGNEENRQYRVHWR